MRTHTRYELQESTSIEEGPITDEVADSPHPGSLGSTAGPSRSISSESADPPVPTLPPLKPKPPSPMDTQTEETDKSMEGTANPSDQWCDMISKQLFPLRFLHHYHLVNAWAQPNWSLSGHDFGGGNLWSFLPFLNPWPVSTRTTLWSVSSIF